MRILARRIGHRGLAAHAPENTLAGIRRAAEFGLRWIEIDIRMSAGNIPVLSHDASLMRCGGAGARVKTATAEKLGAIPVACGFSQFRHECMPSLAAAFQLSRELNLGIVAEIKPDKNRETAAVRAVGDLAHLAPRDIIISSFSARVLMEAKHLLPAIPRALNYNRADGGVFALLKKTGAVNLHCGVQSGKRAMQTAADSGYGVYCFTADDAKTARRVFAAGARGVFTNTG
ncbi:MAG: glycerophosphodiester phosphodiesterase, partial [Gammaproteobacteria bacterium]